MLVVLAIVSILLTMTTPSLKSFSEGRKLRSATETVRNLCLVARDLAMTEKEAYVLVLDFDAQRYWLAKSAAVEEAGDLSLTLGAGAFGSGDEETETVQVELERGANLLGQPRALPQAIRLERMDVDRDGSILSVIAGQDYVQFQPTGTAEPASIYFQNAETKRMVVDVPQEAARARARQLDEDEAATLGF